MSSAQPVVDASRSAQGTRIDLDGVSRRYRVGDVTVTALEQVVAEVRAEEARPAGHE